MLDLLIAAVNARDGDAVVALGSAALVVATERSERRGAEAIKEWVERGYDHLDRIWIVDRVRESGGGELVAVGRSRYVWRESGQVGDETPVGLVISFDGEGLIARLKVLDDPADAPE